MAKLRSDCLEICGPVMICKLSPRARLLQDAVVLAGDLP